MQGLVLQGRRMERRGHSSSDAGKRAVHSCWREMVVETDDRLCDWPSVEKTERMAEKEMMELKGYNRGTIVAEDLNRRELLQVPFHHLEQGYLKLIEGGGSLSRMDKKVPTSFLEIKKLAGAHGGRVEGSVVEQSSGRVEQC